MFFRFILVKLFIYLYGEAQNTIKAGFLFESPECTQDCLTNSIK